MGEAMQFKFGVWTDIDKYCCMHHRLIPEVDVFRDTDLVTVEN